MSKRIPIFLGLILVAIAIWLLITPTRFVRLFIERLDNLGYDLQLRMRILTEKITPVSPVAIIDIDDKSLKAIGRWPWPRSKLAELTDRLKEEGAAVIAFDILFSEKEINIAKALLDTLSKKNMANTALESILRKSEPLFDEDSIFAKSLAENPTVLPIGFLPRPETQNQLPKPLLTLTPEESRELHIIKALGYISNIPILQQAAKGAGFINIFADSDGIIRHAPLLIQYKGGVYPALSLQAVLVFLGENIQLVTPTYGHTKELEGIVFGTRMIPTDDKGQVLIPFIGKSYTFSYYSAIDVLNRNIPKNALLGKILFVGTSATGLGDLVATAVQNPFPGVEIQATLVNGMLEDSFSYKPAWTFGANFVITVLFGLIAAFMFPYFGPRILALLIILVPPSLLLLNNWIWHQTGYILSFLLPIFLIFAIAILNIIYGYLFETRRRERLKEMFGQYVPEKHIDEMLKTTGNYGLHGEDREMSVLFADIRNFTTISEGMSAAELVDMLNTFFTPMTEIIFKHRGTIDKYVGDLIMAFWGAPLKDKNHARHALESAIDMQTKLITLQPMLAERKWPEIKIGIGINSGLMSVGDMGSRFRRNYTVLGDAVNLASRVESLTKFYGVNIIVTENTEQHQSRFVFRLLDRVRVKGKKSGVAIYEVICKKTELTTEQAIELASYHKALEHYFAQRWDEAEALLTQLQQTHAETKIYRIYLDRIKEFKAHPLPPDWDGVYVHATK
ncbi:CHASE2 domain-containing protein [Aquicella lusitana]|uniref:Adenylate cyclase n=1 Tax=Aquicella lusitana TaxID=254246 RepID=A0A370GBV4_9COXI|nr:adenylate/guanylate cyclase domain-containing protein [Aquicella lusitana]RDI41302.1 adenylate cyclase [Aquicella lusitana]VVC72331.1 Adenylate cyclase 1 [Aquicella lusitana]